MASCVKMVCAQLTYVAQIAIEYGVKFGITGLVHARYFLYTRKLHT